MTTVRMPPSTMRCFTRKEAKAYQFNRAQRGSVPHMLAIIFGETKVDSVDVLEQQDLRQITFWVRGVDPDLRTGVELEIESGRTAGLVAIEIHWDDFA